MTLTELKYIVAVARTQNFGRAAEQCFVSQPTLSIAVRKLEEELGVVVFERNRSEVTITPVGEKIVEQARRVLEESEIIKSIANSGQNQLIGPFRLGVIYTVGPYLVPPLIPELQRRAPDLTLLITENFTENLAHRLKHGDIDAAVVSLPFSSPGIVSQPLYDEPFRVVLPKGHALAAKQRLKAGDLSNDTMLLLGAQNCFRDQVIEYCPACAAHPDPGGAQMQQTLEGSSIETIRQMTAAGAGITVLPASSIDGSYSLQEMLDIRPFSRPEPTRRVVLAYRRSFPRPDAIACIAESIRGAPPQGVKVVRA